MFRRSQNAWHEDRTTSDVRSPAGLKGAASTGSRKILINNNIKGAAKHGTGDIPSHCPRRPALGPAVFVNALINWALNKYDAITSVLA